MTELQKKRVRGYSPQIRAAAIADIKRILSGIACREMSAQELKSLRGQLAFLESIRNEASLAGSAPAKE